MPFGNLNFKSPAKRVYGPRMIAVLVAALAKHVTAEKWTFELYRAGSETGISPSHILTAHRRPNQPESAHLCSRHLSAIDGYGGVSKRLFGF